MAGLSHLVVAWGSLLQPVSTCSTAQTFHLFLPLRERWGGGGQNAPDWGGVRSRLPVPASVMLVFPAVSLAEDLNFSDFASLSLGYP